MGLDFRIDSEKGTVYLTAKGVTTPDEWRECFLTLKNHPLRREYMKVLLDFRQHKSVVPTETVLALSGEVEEKARPVRWAFVVSRLVSFGMVNMASIFLARKKVKAKAFWDREEAEAWLQAGG
jgi:hypothetical protein